MLVWQSFSAIGVAVPCRVMTARMGVFRMAATRITGLCQPLVIARVVQVVMVLRHRMVVRGARRPGSPVMMMLWSTATHGSGHCSLERDRKGQQPNQRCADKKTHTEQFRAKLCNFSDNGNPAWASGTPVLHSHYFVSSVTLITPSTLSALNRT